MKEKGLIHIYCGDGKGKTTAAIGLAVRCSGKGKVLFYEFLKDGTSGEIDVLKSIKNIDVADCYKKIKFQRQMTDDEKKMAAQHYNEAFKKIISTVKSNEYDLLVLDEAVHAVNMGYISLDNMMNFLEEKPYGLEVVLTGRNPHKRLIGIADYVTEMKKIKHPFDKGIAARELIER